MRLSLSLTPASSILGCRLASIMLGAIARRTESTGMALVQNAFSVRANSLCTMSSELGTPTSRLFMMRGDVFGCATVVRHWCKSTHRSVRSD